MPLIRRLLADGYRVHLTVVTRTGHAHARRLLNGHIGLSFLPWDLPGFMRLLVRRLQPALMLLTETEFWPGMLAACARRNIPVVGINSRISDRSFPRYYASRWLWQRWLRPVQCFLPQSEQDAQRLRALGLTARIHAVGNLKYDIAPPDVDTQALRQRLDPGGQRPLLLLASSHDDEEARVLRMLPHWRRQCPELLLVLVPRHPERFDHVAEQVLQQGERLHRWQQGQALAETDVVLVDAMGVLAQLYAVADVVIVGGSLVNIGGHNPLEAAVCGRGVLMGPHVQNFRAMVNELRNASAIILIRDDDELQAAVARLLQRPDELRQLHAHAFAFMQRQHGVLDAVMDQLQAYLPRTC